MYIIPQLTCVAIWLMFSISLPHRPHNVLPILSSIILSLMWPPPPSLLRSRMMGYSSVGLSEPSLSCLPLAWSAKLDTKFGLVCFLNYILSAFVETHKDKEPLLQQETCVLMQVCCNKVFVLNYDLLCKSFWTYRYCIRFLCCFLKFHERCFYAMLNDVLVCVRETYTSGLHIAA